MSAAPFFIVSAGRSGTATMVSALAAADGVAIERDHMAQVVQPLAVRRYHGLAASDEAKATLTHTHAAAIRNAQARLWGDASNSLSWLIPDLSALFPQARFIHLVRDGRGVASSYFHTPGHECYDDHSTRVLAEYLSGRSDQALPPEQTYWWPQPKSGEPWAKEFAHFNRFQRIVWHWSEINRVILRDLKDIPEHRRLLIRHEDLRTQPSTVTSLLGFLGLPYRDSHFATLAQTTAADQPADATLTPEQAAQFALLATPMMKRLGYAGRNDASMTGRRFY